MFSRNRPPGGFTTGSTISQAELELWDGNLANALDMLNGGAYAPAADIAIGGGVGVDWTFTLPVNLLGSTLLDGDLVQIGDDFDADLVVNSVTGFYNTVVFNEDATFDADAIFDADVYLNGTAMLVQSQAVFFDDTTFQGSVTFEDSPTFEADAVFDGDVYFNGTAVVCQSQISFSNTITGSGAGRIRARRVHRQAIGGNVDASYAVTSYDHVHVPADTLSAPRTYTIDDTGAIDGDKMRFSSHDVGFSVAVHRPGGVALTSIKGDAKLSCDVERIDGVWKVTNCSATL